MDRNLEAVELRFHPIHYDTTLSKAFLAKYGQADAVKDSVVKNRMGAEFKNQTLTWKGKQVTILMRRLVSKVDEGDAHITTQRWLQALAERQKESHEKSLKDF